jgi:hypothetical protein
MIMLKPIAKPMRLKTLQYSRGFGSMTLSFFTLVHLERWTQAIDVDYSA